MSHVAVKIPIAVSVFLILVLLVLGAPKTASIREHNGLMTSGAGSFDLADAATHSPIVIDGDDDLKAQGWPGNGTEADPYVIEDLIIETSETCISLSNTRAFLVIRSCTLRNVNQFARSGTGISLTNVTNVRVENCTILDKHSGVKSESSSPCCNVSIVSTTCEHISYPFTLQCDNLTIDNCSVADASYGISLSDSGNCTVSNSVVSDCDHYGIYVTGLTSFVITGNRVSECGGGIDVYFGNNGTVALNIVSQCGGRGLAIEYSSHMRVQGNSLHSCHFYVNGQDSEWDIGESNNTVGAGKLGYVFNVSDASVNVTGFSQIILALCDNVTLANAEFNGTVLEIGQCANVRIVNVSVTTSHSRGVYVISSNGVEIRNCSVTSLGANDALRLFVCSNCIVANSTLVSPLKTSICLDACYNVTVANNTMEGWGLGIPDTTVGNYCSHHVANNSVNGVPLYYLCNIDGVNASLNDAGELFVINCSELFLNLTGSNLSSIKLLSCHNCSLASGIVSGPHDWCVTLRDSSNITLSRLNVSGSMNTAFSIVYCENVTLAESTVSGFVLHGVYTAHSTARIVDSTIANSTGHGVNAWSSTCIVTHCGFYNLSLGLVLYYTDVEVSHCRIELGRVGEVASYYCIDSNQCSNVTIIDCVIHGASTGIRLTKSNATIFGLVADGHEEGVCTDHAGLFARNLTLSGIEETAVYLVSSTGSVLEDVNIDTCMYGLTLQQCLNVSVANATVRNATSCGIQLSGTTNSTILNCTVLYGGIGIFADSQSVDNEIRNSSFGGNSPNAKDDGSTNVWDGNAWSDYCGTGSYSISGGAGSVDLYPVQLDTTPPTIEKVNDFAIPEGASCIINWTAVDEFPLRYEVYLNGTQYETGLWDGGTISVSVGSHLQWGTNNVTLSVFDEACHRTSSQVMVRVLDITFPTIHGPEDMTFESGMSNLYLLWDPVDTHPRDYSILDNASVIKSGTWNNSLETIAIDVSGFAPGTHNVTLLVHDADGNAASCSTLVNVLPSRPPEIVPPPDLTYTEGTIGNVIAWSVSDDSPSIYEVTRNDSLIASGVWQVGTIEVGVDYLSPGTYVFMLTVKDMAGNSANDTVLVTVLPRETTTTQTTQTTTVTSPVPGTTNATTTNSGTTGGGTPAPTEFRILGLSPISFAITVAGLCVIVIVAVNYVRLKRLHSGA
ncbi:MAG: right-handed parallel beta-helix repeat-containing protein [Candidatus Thorarchaeota archaeon]